MLARTAVVMILAMAVVVTASPVLARDSIPQPSVVSISLYGSAAQGWGFTPTSITSPGPTISVDRLDDVTVRLEGMDSPRHNFYVDYNGNAAPDPPGEPVSPDFRNSTGAITYSFVATLSGTFTYYCEYHQSTMRGTFIVRAVGAPPSATVSMPDGSRDWTGGTVHRVWWNVSDPDDANPTLVAYLNYTSSAGAGAIAGPLAGAANPNFVDWTLPTIDAADVIVNLTVIDPGGLKAWDEASVPTIDSTAPAVTSTAPAAGATGVPRTTVVQVAWSEAMAAATGSPTTFGLRVSPAGPWVPGTFSWNSPANTTMTFRPASLLQAGTAYLAVVNVTARDDSDSGNALSAPHSWSFTTGTTSDVDPPQIGGVAASPSVQSPNAAVNVSATVTDNVAVGEVWLDVRLPSGGSSNVTMARGVGDGFYRNRTYAELGVHTLVIWASDTSGRWAFANGQFEIRDVAPPAITHTPPSGVGVGEPFNVSAAVTDDGVVAAVRLNWTDTSGQGRNETMTLVAGVYVLGIPMQLRPGTLRYFIWAADGGGNEAVSPAVSLPIQAPADAILLYGDTVDGWGFGPDNLTSPGPTISVAAGTTVRIFLLSVDGIRHNLFVDHDGDGHPGSNEPVSADFRDRGVVLTFVADRPGTFTYYCEYHPGTMRGTVAVGTESAPLAQELRWAWIVLAVVVVAGILGAVLLRRRRPPGHGP